MAALNLHRALFTDKDYDLALRSAAPFLHTAPERDESPTSQLSASVAFQDLIQRQPVHPDGPTSGWDLGLNLLGDPISAAEQKTSEDHKTKMKLRRLHAINIALELLFGIWGTYSTVRYFLAFADGLGGPQRVCAFALGITSALAVALVITSISMSLLPQQSHPRAWRYSRLMLRVSYLLMLSAAAVMNLVLVLTWHPRQFCKWDIDVSWYISTTNTATSPCHTATLADWIVAAVLRVVVTLTLVFSFIYTLRSFDGTRHPNPEGNGPKYSSYFPSDSEYISPLSATSPLRLSKSTLKFTRSEDSNQTLNQSHTTLPKSNSISTLTPSTSCTGHSRSHSTPPPRDVSLPMISPPTSRRTSSSTHVPNHGFWQMPCGVDAPFQTQPVNVVTTLSSVPHMLRRTKHISITSATSDTMLSDIPSCSERHGGSMRTGDASEIRSSTSWKPGHRGTGGHPDGKKTSLTWENAHVRHPTVASMTLEASLHTHDESGSVKEKRREDEEALVYAYGYGASGPTYPYLDMYNPQRPDRYAGSSSCEDEEERGLSQGHRRAIPSGPASPDVWSEPRSSLSREDEEEREQDSGGEEEEYVAMMGGFVRRMATIESLGSREATGTLSTGTGSVARHSVRSRTPVSQFSSVRVGGASGASSFLGVPVSTEGSLSTAYLSFSSGGTGVRVNERGELLPGHDGRGTGSSSYDRHYYTASGSSLPMQTNDDR